MNNLISKNQHGFLQRKSTVTQLLDCFHDFADYLDRGSSIDVPYVDFAKAFDTLSHAKLVHKFRLFGICGQVAKWLQSFLVDRSFRVKLGQAVSPVFSATSGVPQGSVWDLLCFCCILTL